MIPVFQTRTSTETLGNCFEACLASILELELEQIPDRGAHLPDDWAEIVSGTRAAGGDVGELELDLGDYDVEIRDWLREQGLGLLEIEVGGRRGVSEDDWLELMEPARGYWIATHRTKGEGAHAVVYQGASIVHNPHRGMLGAEGLGPLIAASVILALDPREHGLAWARRLVAGAEPIESPLPRLELVPPAATMLAASLRDRADRLEAGGFEEAYRLEAERDRTGAA